MNVLTRKRRPYLALTGHNLHCIVTELCSCTKTSLLSETRHHSQDTITVDQILSGSANMLHIIYHKYRLTAAQTSESYSQTIHVR